MGKTRLEITILRKHRRTSSPWSRSRLLQYTCHRICVFSIFSSLTLFQSFRFQLQEQLQPCGHADELILSSAAAAFSTDTHAASPAFRGHNRTIISNLTPHLHQEPPRARLLFTPCGHRQDTLCSSSSARPQGPRRVPIRTPEQGRSHNSMCLMQPPGSHWPRAHLLHSLASTFLPMLTTGSTVTQPCVTDHTDKPQEAASATLCCTTPVHGAQPLARHPWVTTRGITTLHQKDCWEQPVSETNTEHRVELRRFCSDICGYFSTFTRSTQHRGASGTPNTIPEPRSAAVPEPCCSPQ